MSKAGFHAAPSGHSVQASHIPARRIDRAKSASRSPRRAGLSSPPAPSRPPSDPQDPTLTGPRAHDANAGAAAASGVSGTGSDMRKNSPPVRDRDVERDRQKLFPEARTRRGDSPPD